MVARPPPEYDSVTFEVSGTNYSEMRTLAFERFYEFAGVQHPYRIERFDIRPSYELSDGTVAQWTGEITYLIRRD